MYPFDRFHPVHCLFVSVFILNVVIWNSIFLSFIRLPPFKQNQTNFFVSVCSYICDVYTLQTYFFPTNKRVKNGIYNISGQRVETANEEREKILI